MAHITFILKDGTKDVRDVQEGQSLMEYCRDENVGGIEGACGGSMSCATCHMIIHPDWYEKLIEAGNEKTEEEEDLLDLEFRARDTSRLGCQIEVTEALDGLVVAMPGADVDW